ncbi:hypothetical protein HRbin22_00699 [Candidatus Thermoflexus japonica]|uniref:DUF3368 domain-containing protein n=1 Tax=Candidatus Thermoflexus japonica TaxID=2035417 RepID=A0A2H5Y4T1_9CHLR|nr:hypothetical protein HRbin22_00699 [Candidatus Thermoflexus japonica]
MSAVSNASPLIALARIGRFTLLHDLFDYILVPVAVWQEVVAQGTDRPGSAECEAAADAGWLECQAIQDTWAATLLQAHLGPGESEVIVLARESSAEWLLMDDDLGRAYALRLGLPVKGTVGILVAASHAGLIQDLQEALDALRLEGFRISDHLYSRVLREARHAGLG